MLMAFVGPEQSVPSPSSRTCSSFPTRNRLPFPFSPSERRKHQGTRRGVLGELPPGFDDRPHRLQLVLGVDNMNAKVSGRESLNGAAELGKDEVDQTFAVFANVSLDTLFQLGKLWAFGLGHVEHVHGAESDQHGLSLLGDLPFGFRVLLAFGAIKGARMRMPFCPFFTLRPSWFHAYIPATLDAVGICRAISRMFPKL